MSGVNGALLLVKVAWFGRLVCKLSGVEGAYSKKSWGAKGVSYKKGAGQLV